MVYFVGAGTGAKDLITVRGMRLLQQADTVIYTGSLINPEILDYAREGCALYDSSRLTLEEIVERMREADERGERVVRLHTGDPSVYGAVREQMDELDRLGISYESCPGVSACFGAAASLNLEYTLPGISQSLIITRMAGRTAVPERESIESLAAHRASMAVYLSAGRMEELKDRLIAGGYERDTPAALVYKATWPDEEAFMCTVGELADVAAEHGITRTALALVGEALAHPAYQRSRLYAADFSTGFRKAGREQTKERCGAEKTGIRKLSIIAFTEKGTETGKRVAGCLPEWDVALYAKYQGMEETPSGEIHAVRESVSAWAGARMRDQNALLFVGACGIAVRAAAPWISDKLTDCPVLAMDAPGYHIIPLLGGHAGGANALARMIGERVGAVPVITTATDLEGVFAADLFAQRNGLSIVNKEGIARVSSRALAGEELVVAVETGHAEVCGDRLPEGLCLTSYPPAGEVDILVTSDRISVKAGLLLRPRKYVIGMGCKKGKEPEKIEEFIRRCLTGLGIGREEVYALASLDRKREERGFTEWSRKAGVLFVTYSAEELERAEGDFHASAFVRRQTGVDNVCERAALLCSGPGGRIVCGKVAEDGMTLAVAERDWRVRFDEE